MFALIRKVFPFVLACLLGLMLAGRSQDLREAETHTRAEISLTEQQESAPEPTEAPAPPEPTEAPAPPEPTEAPAPPEPTEGGQ